LFPHRTLKRKKYSNLHHFVCFEKLKIVRQVCENGIFSDFRYLHNGGGGIMLLETLMSDPDSVQKAPPPQRVKNFWCFPGPGVGGSAAWGAPHHRALSLYAFVSILVWSRRSRTFGGLKTTLTTLVNPSTSISNNLFCLLLA
jgi:hypothetical protein